MKRGVIILILILASINLSAQTKAVSGKVTGFNKYPFMNIHVRAKKAKTSVLTDVNGTFTIVCNPKDVLTFESKSCYKQTYKISNPDDSVRVNLVFKDTPESKEYAVGYGIIKESDLTYAISHLSNDNNNFGSYDNIFDLLRGKFADVTVYNNEIRIRGLISINGPTSPLLIVNGIVVNNISHIVPSSVKSIEILKDAATSIYGSVGAAGVVLITLKTGND
jgi:TonB-dependent SusC/RagA subfamily outer membrane receptor